MCCKCGKEWTPIVFLLLFYPADWAEGSVEEADVTRAGISSSSPSQAGLNKLVCVNMI